jgi:hypothetical protein
MLFSPPVLGLTLIDGEIPSASHQQSQPHLELTPDFALCCSRISKLKIHSLPDNNPPDRTCIFHDTMPEKVHQNDSSEEMPGNNTDHNQRDEPEEIPACQSCRKRKLKCSRETPACSQCSRLCK